MRHIELNRLPRFVHKNNGKTCIDWNKSIGYKLEFKYDNIAGEFEIIGYDKKQQYIEFIYKDNEYKIKTSNLLNNNIGVIIGAISVVHMFEIGQVFKDEKRDIVILAQLHDKYKRCYKYKCNVCGYCDGIMAETDIIRGYGCGCCNGKIIKVGFNDLATTEPWSVRYIKGGYNEAIKYTRMSNKKIQVICDLCGTEKSIMINNMIQRKSIKCACGDGKSYPEKFFINVLKQLDVNYKNEFSPEWLCDSNGIKRRFDFCIKNYIVEIDGGYHQRPHPKMKLTAQESLAVDKWKDEQAKEHGYKVFRVNADMSDMGYLKQNILNSLSSVFDLSNIDWEQCDKFALKNTVKEACDLWQSGIMSARRIANILNINPTTARNYLKKGVRHGWCDYKP